MRKNLTKVLPLTFHESSMLPYEISLFFICRKNKKKHRCDNAIDIINDFGLLMTRMKMIFLGGFGFIKFARN